MFSQDEPVARFGEWEQDAVYIVSGEYYYDKTEDIENELPEEDEVDQSEVYTVISREWENGFIYNLRNDEGWRVWNVKEEDLEQA